MNQRSVTTSCKGHGSVEAPLPLVSTPLTTPEKYTLTDYESGVCVPERLYERAVMRLNQRWADGDFTHVFDGNDIEAEILSILEDEQIEGVR